MRVLNMSQPAGRLPMHVLAFTGGLETLQTIASNKKTVLEDRDFNNATLVHHAAAGGQEGVMNYLFAELGVDYLKHVDRNGANPAHWAARSNKLNVLKVIADKMPELLSAKNRDGKSPKEVCFSYDVTNFLKEYDNSINRTHSDPTNGWGAAGIQHTHKHTQICGCHTHTYLCMVKITYKQKIH